MSIYQNWGKHLVFSPIALVLISTACYAGKGAVSQSQYIQSQEVARSNRAANEGATGGVTMPAQSPDVTIMSGSLAGLGQEEDEATKKSKKSKKSTCRSGGTYKAAPPNSSDESLRSGRCQVALPAK